MKDLSNYISFLVDGCGLPVNVELQKNGDYILTVTKDLKYSTVLYKMAIERSEPNIKYVRNQIKKYLLDINVVIKVDYINYPTFYTQITREYMYDLKK